MTRFRPLLLAILLAGCRHATSAPTSAASVSGNPVIPDTATVDGIPTYTHSADAFARAPQFTLDSTPLVVFDGGTNGDFDLTNVYSPLLLADGRLIATPRIGFGWVMLFNADGKPARVLARTGEGPREVRVPATPIPTGSDTVLIADASPRRMNWLTADAGIVRSVPLQHTADPRCLYGISLVAGGRLLGVDSCSSSGSFEKPYRVPANVFLLDVDFGHPDTVVALPGTEIGPYQERRANGGTLPIGSPLRFSRFAVVAPWGTGFVSADGEGGYVLERRGLDGKVTARIRVNLPRRVVTPAMDEAAIQHELGQILNGGEGASMDPKELERRIRAEPVADSLPPHSELFSAPDDLLWVVDYPVETDTTWSATAFHPDGVIVGRLTARMKGARPVWFGKDRVLVRTVDEDGVVRFAVYKVLPPKGG